jgi:hypothetical protein
MGSKYEYDTGEITQIRIGARVDAGRMISGDSLMHFASDTQNCIILGKNELSALTGQYFVFLQQDQIQGWVFYYDLEKLDG